MSPDADPTDATEHAKPKRGGLKVPFGLRGGELVHISQITKGGRQPDCVCPECRRPLIARIPKQRHPHFTHDPGATCSLEVILRSLGKRLIYSELTKALAAGRPVPVTWTCSECASQHRRDNLLKKTAGVRMEKSLGPVRPDVLLVDANDRPLIAIEIVVSHPPAPEAVQYYRDNHIALLEIPVQSAEALEALRHLETLAASSGSVCLRRKCPGCGGPLMEDPLYIVDGECYRCGEPMKVAVRCIEGLLAGPEEFLNDDIARANCGGCILEVRWSSTVKQRYLANVCGRCGAFIGSFHLHDYIFEVSEPIQQDEVYCRRCGRYCD